MSIHLFYLKSCQDDTWWDWTRAKQCPVAPAMQPNIEQCLKHVQELDLHAKHKQTPWHSPVKRRPWASCSPVGQKLSWLVFWLVSWLVSWSNKPFFWQKAKRCCHPPHHFPPLHLKQPKVWSHQLSLELVACYQLICCTQSQNGRSLLPLSPFLQEYWERWQCLRDSDGAVAWWNSDVEDTDNVDAVWHSDVEDNKSHSKMDSDFGSTRDIEIMSLDGDLEESIASAWNILWKKLLSYRTCDLLDMRTQQCSHLIAFVNCISIIFLPSRSKNILLFENSRLINKFETVNVQLTSAKKCSDKGLTTKMLVWKWHVD